uniref:Uncharacterized protein n=1 Tax=Arundo donax TaxID=35708 RepID=A0A0A9B7R4_ARUDO
MNPMPPINFGCHPIPCNPACFSFVIVTTH